MSETRWSLSIGRSVLPVIMLVLAGCSSVHEITGVPKFLGGDGLTPKAIAKLEELPGVSFNNAPLRDNTAIFTNDIIAPASYSTARNNDIAANENNQRSSHSERQRLYSARFEIATGEVERTIDRFVTTVDTIGGYLESRNDNNVVVRVPVKRFDEFVDNIGALGEVLSRSIKNEDVTHQHRDLKLRIESLTASKNRILALMELTANLEEVLKLERELRDLILQLETVRDDFKKLSDQVAFSRIEVDFRTQSVEAAMKRIKRNSTFAWINEVGADRVVDEFGDSLSPIKANYTFKTMLPGSIGMAMPTGFLLIDRKRKGLKAVTSDEAKLWVRELDVAKNGSLDFWTDALKEHLVKNRGYDLVEDHAISDEKDKSGRELTFNVVVRGVENRYLVTLFVIKRSFLSRNNTLRVTEFVAPRQDFGKHVARLHKSATWQIVDAPESKRQAEPIQTVDHDEPTPLSESSEKSEWNETSELSKKSGWSARSPF